MGLERNGRSQGFSVLDKVGRALLVVSLTMLLLLAAGSNHPHLAFGHAAGKTLQAWAQTPPTIDGSIVDSEWQNASSSEFTVTISGNSHSGTLYVMNDATNLYVGIKIADNDFNSGSPSDAAALYFDNDDDGTFEPGEDSVALYAGVEGFVDRFRQSVPSMKIDTDFGGTKDGSGASGGHVGYNHFELSHPINSADDAHDFSLSSLNTVGFTVEYADGDPVGHGYWPALASTDARNWGDIVVASSPPSMGAWYSTAPTIDGTVNATEWSHASHASIAFGKTFVGELWIMNDATNLYVATKIADTTLTSSDQLSVTFDNNNDGIFGLGDDMLFLSGTSQFRDAFANDGGVPEDDSLDGGTRDGEGGASGSGGFNYFELRHPLDSPDNSHDFSLTRGSTVGFSLEYIEASGYWGDWPSHNAKNWGHISVIAPDFSMTCNPSSLSLEQGSKANSTCTVTSINGFNSAVDLSSSWLGVAPTGVNHAVPTPITPTSGGTASSTLMISADPSASTGTFTIRVTATSGSLTHHVDVSVEVETGLADFTISADPSILSLGPNGSGASTITVQSVGIFSLPVDLTTSEAPAGMRLAFGTNPVLPPTGWVATSVLTVTVSGAPVGTNTIIITGTSGSLTRTTRLTVQVTSIGGPCLIATATYGSELSDEVQFLRNFRDKSILRTSTGSSFMAAFNAWYYSFSPSVAQLIREQSSLRSAVKVALYPLIGILRIGAATFQLLPGNSEAGAVTSGLVISSLIGAVYMALPLAALLACSSKARRTAKRLQLPTVVVLLCSLVAVGLVMNLGAPAILMVLATSTAVLASLAASALFASRAITRMARSL